MPKIQNESQLQAAIAQALKPVINRVLEKIVEDNRDLIQEYIYDNDTPEMYERTEEFKEAWETQSAEVTGDHVRGQFSYAPDKMSVDPGAFQHGSYYYNPNDIREYLADIIYQGGAGPLFGEGFWRNKRNVWDRLIKHLGKRRLLSYVSEALQAEGIAFKRDITASLQVTTTE